MQIHELNTFVGTPSSSDYLAIDDGSETYKVGANNLGVTTTMTQAEAEAGTSTQKRVVTPKIFKDAVDSLVNTIIAPILTRLSQIGTVTSNALNNISTIAGVNDYSEGAKITVPAGTYIVTAMAGFTSNATEGIRRVQIFNKTANASVATISEWDCFYVQHTLTFPVTVSAQSVLACRISSGVALSGCTTTIAAIRVA